jgi:O-antigen/teichoic acid export membrane protein
MTIAQTRNDTAPTTPAAPKVSGQHAARDILVQVVIRVLNLALGVVVTALVARTLGKAGYGQLATVFAILGLTGYLTNFGTERVVVREAAREPEHEFEWLGAAMMLRLIMLVPVILVSLGAVVALQESQQMLVAGVILILGMPFDGIGTIALIFQLRVRNTVPMLVLTLRSVLWAGAVVFIHLSGGGMVALAIGLAVTNGIGSIVQALAARRLVGRWPRPSRKRLGALVRVGVPLGISGVLVTAYANIDQVIVFQLGGSGAAGLYGAVYGLLEQAHFVPISVLTTMGTIIAASWPRDRERMLRAAQTTAELMAIGSFGGLALVSVAATPIVRLVFGSGFVAAAPALPVLFGAFIFICFGYLNGNLLAVLGLQRKLLWISLIALVVNVVGNLALVPIIGFMGAAWMTLITEIVVWGLSLRLILRTLEMRRPPLGRLGRTALAAVVLGGGLAALQLLGAQLWLIVGASGVLYPGLLFGLRALRPGELRVLIRREAPA